MSFVQVEKKGNYAILTLDRGKSNPLNQAFINELSATLLEIENESSIKGLVISGKENFFSAGLDLIEMSQFSRNEYINFWKRFFKILNNYFKISKTLGGCNYRS
ncbi:MAG: enoyl-CoA hydratase/isomerase family protein [Bacteroidetes bacterium]|nr:enoyl-CoA hydratase/isomerase family protein [Bacteroidota bacterium]